ncbi:MAG: response regulator, partial [Bdellovibrionota bacterium]
MKYLLSLIGPGYACAKRVADLLVVDDDSDVAAPLLELLQLEGHTVRWAEDGLAGLVCISQRIPDLILLDVEMPQMSGPEMGAELFACNQGREKIPILLLS